MPSRLGFDNDRYLAQQSAAILERVKDGTSRLPTPGDAAGLRKLGVNATSDPEFATKHLFEG